MRTRPRLLTGWIFVQVHIDVIITKVSLPWFQLFTDISTGPQQITQNGPHYPKFPSASLED